MGGLVGRFSYLPTVVMPCLFLFFCGFHVSDSFRSRTLTTVQSFRNAVRRRIMFFAAGLSGFSHNTYYFDSDASEGAGDDGHLFWTFFLNSDLKYLQNASFGVHVYLHSRGQ